ncbi:helix-turn-helix domain-containing protein [Streptomyces sp. R11]|uniref:Helix-turn-helix domain-containing protein n=1 Tax=Streptomyces sp. R11 TaxID=3238625 RepID=A0AB39N105_9ACTN
MRVQRTRHTRAYVQIPNEIAQSNMSLSELGLLVKLLSLPDKNNATVEKITTRVPDGRRTVSNAMAGLVERRYVHRARVQDPESGRWVTLTSVSDTPTDHIPTVGEPTTPDVGDYPKGKDAERNDHLPTPPAEEPDGSEGSANGEGEEEAPQKTDDALTERAVKALHRLAIHEPRLLLTNREAQRLAPLAARWLSEGFHEMEVIRTLTKALPSPVASAAALVHFRLKNHEPERTPAPMPSQAPSEPVNRAECPKCHRPYRAGHPGGICRDCREDG